jgi:hypothetical protein
VCAENTSHLTSPDPGMAFAEEAAMLSKRLVLCLAGVLSIAACDPAGAVFTEVGVSDKVGTGGQGMGAVAGFAGTNPTQPETPAVVPMAVPTPTNVGGTGPSQGGEPGASAAGSGEGGDAAVEDPSGIDDGSSVAPQPDPLKCEQGCAGVGTCQAGVCVVTCSDAHPCTSGTSCPKGLPCKILCQGERACPNGVQCTGAESCDIACEGNNSCAAGVTCAGSHCSVACSGPKACPSETNCTAAQCDITCSGDESCLSRINCGAQTNQCNVSCTGAGSCPNGIGEATTGNVWLACTGAMSCTSRVACNGASCGVVCGSGACSSGVCCTADFCALTGVANGC